MKSRSFFTNIKNAWFEKGVLRLGVGTRNASWIELFFDLVFISGLSVLNSQTFKNGFYLNSSRFLYYAFSFLVIWLIWLSVTIFSNQFENNSVRHRFILFLNMLSVGLLTLGIENTLSDHLTNQYSFYIVCIIISRMILIYTWNSPNKRRVISHILLLMERLTKIYLSVVVISTILFINLLFNESSYRISIFILILLILFELGAVVFVISKSQENVSTLHQAHIRERFGLFTMLMLGEMVINALNAFRYNFNFTLLSTITLLLLLFYLFMFWWLYYDQVLIFHFRDQGSSRTFWILFHCFLSLICLLLGPVISGLNGRFGFEQSYFNIFLILNICLFLSLTILHLSLDISSYQKPKQRVSKLLRLLTFKNLIYVRLFTIICFLILVLVEIPGVFSLIITVSLLFTINVFIGLIVWSLETHNVIDTDEFLK